MAALLMMAATPARAAERLVDRPVAWNEDDRRDIPKPAERDPNLLLDGIDQSFFEPISRITDPGRILRRLSVPFGNDHVIAAVNLNALDEVPNSAWFTNRIGLSPMAPEDVVAGPGRTYGLESADGPDTTGAWTVIRAKTEGVTPGFNIKDARGHVYVIKFDDPRYPHMSSAANAITGRLLHAAGYNVPADFVVLFDRTRLRLGDNVMVTDPDGTKRPMLPADIDSIIARVRPEGDGRRRAIASRYLPGEPVGPFDWEGRRKDDPNDHINHEDRRELRGFRMFCAWLAHFDTKQGNTLDMWVDDAGRKALRHHVIDFASTLGTGATGPWRTYSYEYSFDVPAIGGRMLGLGFHEDKWRQLESPKGLDEVAYFQGDIFDPLEFKPLVPNAAFANFAERDGYWAAKIISAFTDEHLEAAVSVGQYEDPEAARWMTRMLAERRDKIARLWFDRVPPLDYFRVDVDWAPGMAMAILALSEPIPDPPPSGTIRFNDLGAERGLYPDTVARYRCRGRRVDAERHGGDWSAWQESATTRMAIEKLVPPIKPGKGRPFLAFEVQVDRGSGWSRSIKVFASRTGSGVIAVER